MRKHRSLSQEPITRELRFFCLHIWGFICTSFPGNANWEQLASPQQQLDNPVPLQSPYQENTSEGHLSLLRNLLIKKMHCCSEGMFGKENSGVEAWLWCLCRHSCYLVHLLHCALHILLWPPVTYGPNAFVSSRQSSRQRCWWAQLTTNPIARPALHFWSPLGSWHFINRFLLVQELKAGLVNSTPLPSLCRRCNTTLLLPPEVGQSPTGWRRTLATQMPWWACPGQIPSDSIASCTNGGDAGRTTSGVFHSNTEWSYTWQPSEDTCVCLHLQSRA